MGVRGGFGAEVEVGIARLRSEIAALHRDLAERGDADAIGGTVSGRVTGADLFVIKPDDISFADLAPEHMVLCTLDGDIVEGTPGADRRPAADTLAHAAVYRRLATVGGIALTGSPYASAWALVGESLPCVTSAMRAAFGGEIPVGPLVDTRGEALGEAIADTLTRYGTSAVLMTNHGPCTTGPDARTAVRSAALLEHAARVAFLARQLGEPSSLAVADANG